MDSINKNYFGFLHNNLGMKCVPFGRKAGKAKNVAEQCLSCHLLVRDSDAKSLTCNFLFGNVESDGILMRIKGLFCDFSRRKQISATNVWKATSSSMSCDNDRFRIAFKVYRSIPLSIFYMENKKTY